MTSRAAFVKGVTVLAGLNVIAFTACGQSPEAGDPTTTTLTASLRVRDAAPPAGATKLLLTVDEVRVHVELGELSRTETVIGTKQVITVTGGTCNLSLQPYVAADGKLYPPCWCAAQPTLDPATGITIPKCPPGAPAPVPITLSTVAVPTTTTTTVTDEVEGWVTLCTGPITVDLFAAENPAELCPDVSLTAGRLTQIRLITSGASLSWDDGSASEVKLPSGDLKVVGLSRPLPAGAFEEVVMDFEASSLHEAGGGWTLRPTVRAE